MPFEKGKSGNPAGRRKGSKNWTTLQRDEMREYAPKLLKMVLKQAIDEKDIAAARLYLDKCLPNLKATDEPVVLAIDTDQPSAVIAKKILQQIGAGTLSIDDGSRLISAIGDIGKQTELQEILDTLREMND